MLLSASSCRWSMPPLSGNDLKSSWCAKGFVCLTLYEHYNILPCAPYTGSIYDENFTEVRVCCHSRDAKKEGCADPSQLAILPICPVVQAATLDSIRARERAIEEGWSGR